jgi:hypothetical protein
MTEIRAGVKLKEERHRHRLMLQNTTFKLSGCHDGGVDDDDGQYHDHGPA